MQRKRRGMRATEVSGGVSSERRSEPRRIASHHHAIGAYDLVSSWHALGACEVGSRKVYNLTA